jgi:hypothetical protein
MSLPSNDALTTYSADVSWQEVENIRRHFTHALETLTTFSSGDTLPLDALSEAVGTMVTSYYDASKPDSGNVLLTEIKGHPLVLGSYVSKRYRSGHSLMESVVPYNLNPSVNHSNIEETEDSLARLRVLGAEIELGLVHPDGHSPTEDEVQGYITAYASRAQRLGVYPRLDREACQYQVEAHIAPSVGYNKTRNALFGMLTALAAASRDTNLRTLIFSCYPTDSDFKMTNHPKVLTAGDLMLQVNGMFPEYAAKLSEVQQRYHVDPTNSQYINMFRNQGCHIHIDLAGRSEALGLLTFYTVLKSATTIANSAVLKGCPFVNGTGDPDLLCAREYLRSVTVTGRYLDLPLSPHFTENGLDNYSALLALERANATGRAMMYDEYDGEKISLMHNPIGRVRPDLGTPKRVCTVESTGMPTNISASRMAAVLVDFEFSHAVIESYFRKHGCDLEPMHDDKAMWDILGPLNLDTFKAMQDRSDVEGTDVLMTLNSGREIRLSEFYDMKRRFMHRALEEIDEIAPRDIDEVYSSLERMLEPPSGHAATTITQYINNPKLRSTGNWGRILRDAYLEAGGTLGDHCPDAVLDVVNQVHEAMCQRYLNE